jgi:protein-disulfide isomerase
MVVTGQLASKMSHLKSRWSLMRKVQGCLLIFLILATAVPVSAESAKTNPDAAKALTVQPEDRILGKPEAPITIIEYESLTCPHCAKFAVSVLPKLREKWIENGKAKLVMRDYPLDERAMRAAMVTRCAPPDRYYPLTEMFFAQAEEWVLASDYRALLERLAKLGGMSSNQFAACITDKKLEDEVAQSRLTASQQLGVQATPTFFINGEKFDGEPTAEAFDHILSELATKRE